MLITTVPSITIAIIILTIAGFSHEASNTEQIATFLNALDGKFNITPWLLIVPVATAILIAKRIPPIITLFLSATMAGVCAVIFQPELLHEISGSGVADASSTFKGMMMTFYGSTSLETTNPALTELVSTRGMSVMMDTIWLIICALSLGGAISATGTIGSISFVFVRSLNRTVRQVASTVPSGLFMNLASADQ